MKELFTSGLFWFYVLAEFFVFYMQRTARNWKGANQVTPMLISMISSICGIALIVLIIFVFIKIRPFWYGIIMLVAGFIAPLLLAQESKLEWAIGMLGLIGAPLFTILSFLKLFAVI